ncbi:MAG: HD domain-containing protein, partial [Marinobacter sp.]|nr:HD domain-containing protein [Marinobacter sp.]
MVKVREDYATSGDGEVNIDQWVEHIAEQTHLENPDQLHRACEKAAVIDREAFREDRLWAPGASSFFTGLEMAQVLAELRMDQASLVAAVLYRAVREERVPLEEIRKEFGDEVAGLINGVQQMAAISSIHHPLKGNVLGQSE